MKTIFVAGHNGMVGSAIRRKLEQNKEISVLTAEREILDLTDQKSVESFFKNHSIDEVYLAAAKVGGIHANSSFPADFIYQNLMIQNNVIHMAYQMGIKKLLFLGSSCIYPKMAPQPMSENTLLTGLLEPTNEPYAIAKIAGIKLCESYNRQYGTDFRAVMPTNLYGPGDNFSETGSHVIPALIRRFHNAKKHGEDRVRIWGTGKPLREFLHVDDLASACVFYMGLEKAQVLNTTTPMLSHINVGWGSDITIGALADLIAEIVEYKGEIIFDTNMPDGTPKKLLDSTKLRSLGWQPELPLREGLGRTYQWFLENQHSLRLN